MRLGIVFLMHPSTPRSLTVTRRLLAGGSVSRVELEAEIDRDLDPAVGICGRDVVNTMLRMGWVGVVGSDGPDGTAILGMPPTRERVA